MTIYIGYARVSTDKQGRSGLGLEAQEATIRRHLAAADTLLMPIMVEVESGRKADRPVLAAALAKCRLHGATLLVAKLDRLARDAAFVASLMASGVPVEFCDLPQSKGATGTFLLGIMAHVAQLEAGLISERTKAALQAARERGVKLGGYRGGPTPSAAVAASRAARGRVASQAKANARAELLAPTLGELAGLSLHQMASELTRRGIVTPRGGSWTATAVRRALARTRA